MYPTILLNLFISSSGGGVGVFFLLVASLGLFILSIILDANYDSFTSFFQIGYLLFLLLV